jgi:acetyltransferase
LRPIRPEDEASLRGLISDAEVRDLRLPLSNLIRDLPHTELARLTQIDYEREMTFVAVAASEVLAGVHSLSDPDNIRAEFGIFVHPAVIGRGLERLLLDKLILYLRGRGIRQTRYKCEAGNKTLIALARSLGFHSESDADPNRIDLTLNLV